MTIKECWPIAKEYSPVLLSARSLGIDPAVSPCMSSPVLDPKLKSFVVFSNEEGSEICSAARMEK